MKPGISVDMRPEEERGIRDEEQVCQARRRGRDGSHFRPVPCEMFRKHQWASRKERCVSQM